MKNTLVILLSVLSFNVVSQVPTNFEFLNHKSPSSQIGASHILDNGVLYVSHNSSFPMTEIVLAKFDNTIEVLFASGFSSQSKKVINRDSSIQLLIYNLFDYDVGATGFHEAIVLGQNVEVNSYFDGYSPDFEEGVYITDITSDTLGNFYFFSNLGLSFYRKGEPLINYNLDKAYNNIHITLDGKIYLLGGNSSDKYISLINGSEIIPINVPPFQVFDIQNSGTNVHLLTNEGLKAYSSDFSTLIYSLDIGTNIRNFKQVSVVNDTVYVLSSMGDVYKVHSYDFFGNRTELHSELSLDKKLKGLHVLDTNNFLFEGLFSYQFVTRNGFFRNHNLHGNNDYKSIEIEVSDYKIEQTKKDSFYAEVIFNGDSIFYFKYFYDISYVLKNNSSDTIINANNYTRPYVDVFGPSPFFQYSLENSLAPNESFLFEGSFVSSPASGNIATLELITPGANFRFNESGTRVILPDLKSDVRIVDINSFIKIFPNPTSHVLNFNSEDVVCAVSVYTMNGQLVLYHDSAQSIVELDVSRLANGHYILQTNSGTEKIKAYSKFVKI